MHYVCMGCGFEWDTDHLEEGCPKCRVGDIYLEDNNDNQKHRTEEDAKREGQTTHNNNVV